MNAATKRWEIANPERKRAYRKANVDKHRELMRRVRASDPERHRGYVKAWRDRNPELVKAWRKLGDQRRRARKRDTLIVRFSKEQLAERLSMFAGCFMCGGDWSEIEHVKPLAAGGAHCLANLRPACGDCNRRKGSTWLGVAWIKSITFSARPVRVRPSGA